MAAAKKIFLSFNNGTAVIYSVDNISQPGDKPKDGLVEKCGVRYRELTVGISRYYEAMQAQIEISKLISIPDVSAYNVSTQDVVVINKNQYRIVQVQKKTDTLPPSMTLSLAAIKEAYEVVQKS